VFYAEATPCHAMDTQETPSAACADNTSTPLIFSLPDEILLTIADLLAENCHLVQLSLVNTKLRHVAQEALLKKTIVPPNGIGKLVKMYVHTALMDVLLTVHLEAV
jgi:hypothetical protein